MPAVRSRFMSLAIAGLKLAGTAAASYGAVLALLWFHQEKLLFMPTVLPAGQVLSMAPDVHEVSVTVPGARLSALHLRLPDPKGVVFFLHGNAGALDTWFVNPQYYRRANFDLFMLDYRGYGKSTGRIESEQQLRADVRAAWASVAPRYAGRKVVVYGRSLGSGLAAGLAAELSSASQAPDLTVLVSPYGSLSALARDHYPWVPQALLRYPMRTDQQIGLIRGPLLLIHGLQDTLIEPRHSEELKRMAPQATVLGIAGAGHNDLQEFEQYLRAFAQALADL